MSTIQYIAAALLQPGDNTRKTFETESLTRLKGSIRTYGVRRNLEVKPLPDGKYEIVTGERRWRATMELLTELDGEQRAKREMLPCLVLDAREESHSSILNIIENLLRDNVPPGEEAEGYFMLTQSVNPDTGKPWTVSEIAEAVNQDAQYIRRRMQLRRSPAILLDAVNARKIPVTIAELVGRIPSREMREVAAKLVLWPGNQEVPMDFEQAKRAISDRFYRTLEKPGFAPESEDLVPAVFDKETGERLHGGACETCPHRSGNALEKEELAGGNTEGGKGRKSGVDPNLCTNIDCFRMKQNAAWAIARKQAEDKGQKVIEADAAKRVFSGDKGKLPNDSKYVDLDEKPREDMAGANAEKLPKWQVLRNQSGEKVNVIVARHHITGRTHHLLAKEDAEKILISVLKPVETAEVVEVAEAPVDAPQAGAEAVAVAVVDSVKERQQKERREKKIKREVLIDCFEELFEAIVRDGVDEEDLLLSIELALISAREACRIIADWLAIKVKDANSWRDYVPPILAHVASRFETHAARLAFLQVCLAAQDTDYKGVQAAGFERMAGAFRVSIGAIDALVRKAHDLAGGKSDESESEVEAVVNTSGDPEKTPNLREWVAPQCVVVESEDAVEQLSEQRVKPNSRQKAPRVPDKEAENKAWEAYLKTGKIQDAATAAGVTINTVKKWHQRRGWKKKREVEMKK